MEFNLSGSKSKPIDQEPIKLILQLYKITSLKDGGSRIVFECGLESLPSVQKLQTVNALGEVSFAVACVPYKGG